METRRIRKKHRVTFICSGCGKGVERDIFPSKFEENDLHFCSRACQNKWMSKGWDEKFNGATVAKFFIAELKKGRSLSAWEYAYLCDIKIWQALNSIANLLRHGWIVVDEISSEDSPTPKYKLSPDKSYSIDKHEMMFQQPEIWHLIDNSIRETRAS